MPDSFFALTRDDLGREPSKLSGYSKNSLNGLRSALAFRVKFSALRCGVLS